MQSCSVRLLRLLSGQISLKPLSVNFLAQFGKACAIFPGVSTPTLSHRKSSLVAFSVSATTVDRQSIDI